MVWRRFVLHQKKEGRAGRDAVWEKGGAVWYGREAAAAVVSE